MTITQNKEVGEVKALHNELQARKNALVEAQNNLDQIEQRTKVYIWLRYGFGVIGELLWNLKQIAFGFLLCLCLSALFSALISIQSSIDKPEKIQRKKDRTKKLTAEEIAKEAPKDPKKRQILVKALRTAEADIANKTITNRSDIIVTIKTNIGALIANKDWYSTIDAINAMFESADDVETLTKKINELIESFE
ncbi:MAG: hypothetical protein LBC74_14795 [Planctomycetaceae bacterium]|nr:hypothetical protein [Planctomycetaceae bacterium]